MTPETAFDQYHNPVFRFLYRLTRRADVAEDLTQECFLAMMRHPERFDESRGTVRTYLFSIARNLALKHYRDHRAETPLEDEEPPQVHEGAGLEIACAVERAVASLPPLQQEALILFEYECLTLEEIARVVEADLGSVKSRLHRARQRLKRVLAPYRKGTTHGSI